MKYIKKLGLCFVFTILLVNILSVKSDGIAEIDTKSNSDFEYSVDENNTITIKAYKTDATEISIPSSIEGLSVTKIGENAFRNCSNLKNITLPDTITYIGFRAFSCSSLESIVIPDSVVTIEAEAFKRCTHLRKIYFSNSLESIPNCVCSECSTLEEIFLPINLTYIGDYAFSECKKLSKIYIPDNITRNGENIFSYCSNIEQVITIDKEHDNASKKQIQELFPSEISKAINYGEHNTEAEFLSIKEYSKNQKIKEGTEDAKKDGTTSESDSKKDGTDFTDNSNKYKPVEAGDKAKSKIICGFIISIGIVLISSKGNIFSELLKNRIEK